MQKYLNLVDWKGLELSSSMRRCKVSVKKFGHSPEWIERKETLVEFQAERCKKTSDDEVSDDMTSKAECKRKSDSSPVQFCCRSLSAGNVWDSLVGLLKIMKLHGLGNFCKVPRTLRKFPQKCQKIAGC